MLLFLVLLVSAHCWMPAHPIVAGSRASSLSARTLLGELGVPLVVAQEEDESFFRLEQGTAELSRYRVAVGPDETDLILNVLSHSECESMIKAVSSRVASFNFGKNNHDGLQVYSSESWASEVARRLEPYLDPGFEVNRRLRVYAYQPDGEQTFSRHVDSAFDKATLDDQDRLIPDESKRGRYSILLYLNGDFEGGETAFYEPLSSHTEKRIAAVKPVAGAALIFPQAGPDDDAEWTWPTHEGAPVLSGRTKYVVRTDALYPTATTTSEEEDNEVAISRAVSDGRRRPDPLYSPYMGVERAAPLLYALVRFLKPRRITEIGAGYTSLSLLRALRDNDREMANLRQLGREKRRLLDWPWTVDDFVEDESVKSSLRCIDDCKHGAQTADMVRSSAAREGLEGYLAPLDKRDAFEARFDPESIDFFWCDFGAADKLPVFLEDTVLPALKNGGFVAIHSAVTNQASRRWLDSLRDKSWPPSDHLHHISLLEPHKTFQNSITLLQKRSPPFKEPLYSERP